MHILIDILRNSILITGLVVVMMMMIESLNIESKGRFFSGLRKTRIGQVAVAALLGSIPGCMGGFATVSLYTHRMMSFGALVAMMIASSGDEAFVMLAMIPREAVILTILLLVLAIAVGIVIDLAHGRRADPQRRNKATDCHHGEGGEMPDQVGYEIHEDEHIQNGDGRSRHFGLKRILLLAGLAIFIGALATGKLGHDHSAHTGHMHNHIEEHSLPTATECHSEELSDAHSSHSHSACKDSTHHHGEGPHLSGEDGRHGLHIDLLSEDWMNILFAALSLIVLVVLVFASDHFVEEHIWNHIIRKHLLTIFLWTFGVLLALGIGLQFIDIDRWISDNTVLMILLATAIGIIPESGPHMIFVTLFAAGIVPFPVLLASSISQDGHASIPLLAESRRSFLWAKLINCMVAIAAGFTAMLFI